ncbi:MAG: hypothetical protein DYH05_12820 [Acidobacteria bacterium ACB1]|nr:hypothetical protein [Acidobacteria bacterium ACB1]RIJ92173.1 MAG: hypothetical protein DCC44_08455 [Acidobacteriota bacterium]
MGTVKILTALFCITVVVGLCTSASGQTKRAIGQVCGDPTAKCAAAENFQPYDLAFETGADWVIVQSKPFYGIVLKSVKVPDWGDCAKPSFPESERLEIQELFPKNKVFAQNCVEPGTNYYTGTADKTALIGVFAGNTLREANAFLKKVQATGKFKNVRVRKMRIEINGT